MNDSIKEAFGIVIKSLREEKGLSQQEIADYAEMDRTFVSDMERGIYAPSLVTIVKLAEVFKMKPHLLILEFEKQLSKK